MERSFLLHCSEKEQGMNKKPSAKSWLIWGISIVAATACFSGALLIGLGFFLSWINMRMGNPTHQWVAAADVVAIVACLVSSYRLAVNFSSWGLLWLLMAGGTFYLASYSHSLPGARGLIH